MGLGKVKWPPGRYAYLRLLSTDICDYLLFNARSFSALNSIALTFSANGRVCNRQGRSRGSTRRRVAPTRTSLARRTNPSKEHPRRSLTPRRRQRPRRMTNPRRIAARRPPPRKVMARRRRQGTRRNLEREPVRLRGSPARTRTSVRRLSRRRSRLRRRQRLPRSDVCFRYAVGNGSCLCPFFSTWWRTGLGMFVGLRALLRWRC